MKPIFKSSLIKDVVISYVCMIVFPVMIILGMVFLLAGRYIYRAATESVTVTQQAVLELYKEEMRGSALALSRVVNMNGGTTIQDASGYDTQKQEQAMEQLYTMYQMLAAPEYKILDIHIYRKDGTAIIPKGEMRYSVDELRQKEWYQAALRQPGLVHTSLVEEDYFYRIRSSQEILEISAYAPREDTEAECIVLYRVSKIPDSIKNYNKSGRMGTLCLINGQGRIVADPGQKTRLPSAVTEKIRQNAADLAASDQPAAGNPPASNNHIAASTQQQISYRGIRYMILPLPEPGYYLVSAVNETSPVRAVYPVFTYQYGGHPVCGADVHFLFQVVHEPAADSAGPSDRGHEAGGAPQPGYPGGNVQTAGYRPDDFHLQQHGGAD